MPRLQFVSRAPSAPRSGVRGVPFGRKAWDNPVRFPLDRAYGDEFEEKMFSEIQRRWNLRNIVAADLSFPGGSSIEWLPSGAGSHFWKPAPSGDFEAILEYQSTSTAGNGMAPAICLLDSSGNGSGFSLYNDGNIYGWNVSAWAYGSTGGGQSYGTLVGQHMWVAVRRTGTTLSCRWSSNGTSWSNIPTTFTTNVATNNRLTIGRLYSGSNPGWQMLHRFNVYSGPSFFTG